MWKIKLDLNSEKTWNKISNSCKIIVCLSAFAPQCIFPVGALTLNDIILWNHRYKIRVHQINGIKVLAKHSQCKISVAVSIETSPHNLIVSGRHFVSKGIQNRMWMRWTHIGPPWWKWCISTPATKIWIAYLFTIFLSLLFVSGTVYTVRTVRFI